MKHVWIFHLLGHQIHIPVCLYIPMYSYTYNFCQNFTEDTLPWCQGFWENYYNSKISEAFCTPQKIEWIIFFFKVRKSYPIICLILPLCYNITQWPAAAPQMSIALPKFKLVRIHLLEVSGGGGGYCCQDWKTFSRLILEWTNSEIEPLFICSRVAPTVTTRRPVELGPT